MKRLNLGGNVLTSVPQRSLSIFDNLKKLELQENKIRVIKEGDFEGKNNLFDQSIEVYFDNKLSDFCLYSNMIEQD